MAKEFECDKCHFMYVEEEIHYVEDSKLCERCYEEVMYSDEQ